MLLHQPEQVVSLIDEQLYVDKRQVVTDQVQVTTHVEERAVMVEDTLERGSLQIERVPLDILVSQAPSPRQEGDTLIVSVVEERLVVEKRLFVIEELRITRHSTCENISIAETVRTMRATVERVDPASSTGREIDG